MRFKITILFLFLGLFASAQFHSPYYHASVVDSLILKHRGDTLFHIRLSHNRDTLFINNSYFVGGIIDTTVLATLWHLNHYFQPKGSYDSTWTEDLTLGRHWIYLRRATDSIGIGTYPPTAKLDVNGEIKAYKTGGGNAVYGHSSDGTAIDGYSDNAVGVNGSTGAYGSYGGQFSCPSGSGVYATTITGQALQVESLGSGMAISAKGRSVFDTVIITKAKLRTGLDTIMVMNHDTVYKQLLPTVSSLWKEVSQYLTPVNADIGIYINKSYFKSRYGLYDNTTELFDTTWGIGPRATAKTTWDALNFKIMFSMSTKTSGGTIPPVNINDTLLYSHPNPSTDTSFLYSDNKDFILGTPTHPIKKIYVSHIYPPITGTTYTATSPVQMTGSVISLRSDTLTQWYTKMNEGALAYSLLPTKEDTSTTTFQHTLSGNTVQRYAGNVGIGTTSPRYNLDVNGSIEMGGGQTFSINTNIFMAQQYTPGYQLQVGLLYYGTFLDAWTNHIGLNVFNNGSTGIINALYIPSGGVNAGNVGIGTITPSEKIEVNGKVQIDTIPTAASQPAYVLVPNSNVISKYAWPTGTTYTATSPVQIVGSVISVDTTTAKTGIATLYQLGLKANKATTITINGTAYDLSSNRSWTIPNYWQRTSTTLSPTTAQDNLQVYSNQYTTGDFENTHSGSDPAKAVYGYIYGSNAAPNYAFYATASGGSSNYSFFGNAGMFLQNDSSYFGNYLRISPISAPSPVTDKLYNVGHSLYWNGAALGTGTGSVTNITMGYGLSSTQSPLTTTGTMKVDSTVLVSTVRFGHLTAYPTLNQSTTGSAGSVGHTLGNGYGITSLSFNGSATGTAIADTSVLVSTVRHGHITSYPTLNQSTTGQAGSVAGTLSNGYGINTLSFNGSGSTTVVADSSHLISTVRFSHLTAFPTLNQSTTGQAGSVANALTNGYGLNTFTYNGSGAISPVVDTTHIISTVRFGHLTAFPTLNQNTSGSSGSCTGNSVTATTATNITGGLGGSIPYQTAASTTTMLANGSAGQYLQSQGTTLAPNWATVTATVDTTTAGTGLVNKTRMSHLTAYPTLNQNTTGTANVAGGTVGAVPYQSAANTTGVVAATATAGLPLISGANAIPTWATSPPLYKSTIRELFPPVFVDTSALISSGKVLIGYSGNITIDTLIYVLNRRAGTPSITPTIKYGTDWTASGTSVVTAPGAVTSYSTPTKVSGGTLNNITISAGNLIWMTWTETVAPKELYVIILGHYN